MDGNGNGSERQRQAGRQAGGRTVALELQLTEVKKAMIAGIAKALELLGLAYLGYEGIKGIYGAAKAGISAWRARSAAKAAATGAAAAAQAAKQALGARGIAAQTAEQIAARIQELENLARAAEAAGDVRSARAYRAMATKLAEPLASLTATAQIGREQAFNKWLGLVNTAALVGFTVEEWRQATMFRQNLDFMNEMNARRDAATMAMVDAIKDRVDATYAQIAAQERNNAFWKWYLEQKTALEMMKLQAQQMKQGLYGARKSAGSKRGGLWDKQALAAIKAYESAVKTAHRAWLEWQKALAQINVENVKAINEQQAIVLRAKWDAFLEAMKHAYEQQEIAMKHYAEMQQIAAKAQWDMMKTAYETQQKAALATHEAQLEARVAWEKAAAEAAAEREKAKAKAFVIREEAIWERINEIGKQYGEAAKVSLAELYKAIREAEEAAKEGKEYHLTLPVWTPQGAATAVVRTQGRRVKVDIKEQPKRVAMQFITKVFWK
ncbi:MAG: hypothetical protein QXG57_06145 [Thermofilaceae archaeon]